MASTGGDATGEGRRGRRPPAAAASTRRGREPAAGTAGGSARTRRRTGARSSPGEAAAARLQESRVCVCMGAGGVGKTTAAAALAVGMAMRGHKVAVVTIDPARRLATALGMRRLEGELERIQPSTFEAQRVSMPGEVWAMTLDVKRTFDALVARVTGVDLLGDLSSFFGSLSGVIDGFGARTREVAALLRDPATVFMIVTSPESEPAREAAFLARTLDARGMRRGGLIVNRVHSYALEGQPVERARELLAPAVGERLASRAAANLADFDVLAERDKRAIARLQRELRVADPVLVPHLDQDVRDLAALARFAGYLLS